jgi:hypothetical protein
MRKTARPLGNWISDPARWYLQKRHKTIANGNRVDEHVRSSNGDGPGAQGVGRGHPRQDGSSSGGRGRPEAISAMRALRKLR